MLEARTLELLPSVLEVSEGKKLEVLDEPVRLPPARGCHAWRPRQLQSTWLASLFSTTRLLCVQADAIFSAAVAAPSHAGAVAAATLSATPYFHTPPASTQPSGRSPVPSPAAEDASRTASAGPCQLPRQGSGST